MKGITTRPPIEDTNTILPRARRSAGSSARVRAIWPKTLTSNWPRSSSLESISSGPPTPIPALLTSASRRTAAAGVDERPRRLDLCLVGDVEQQRLEPAARGLGRQLLAGLLGAHPGQHPPARAGQAQRAWRGRSRSRRR